MAVNSGSTYRLQWIATGGVLKVLYGATQGQVNHETNTRSIVHKDIPGNHTLKIADGRDTTQSATFFLDQTNGDYDDLYDLWAAGTEVDLAWSSAVATTREYAQTSVIKSLGAAFAVRDSVVCNISFESAGDVTVSVII